MIINKIHVFNTHQKRYAGICERYSSKKKHSKRKLKLKQKLKKNKTNF